MYSASAGEIMKSTSNELRQLFLDYFAERDHEVVPSSPLVPGNDPTLLFTNAGMVQFKDVFLGQDKRSKLRAVSSQRCVRAGGKHNDLENVGYTARHHTLFEMLGNFSFGDYFKQDAIRYAWEFLTEVLNLPPERLWCTVFEDDDEAAQIWLNDIGVDPDRFGRLGAKDNFWAMGNTGPCGPCSEIFYDHGRGVAGGPPGSQDEDGDRFVEIWNLVFMQFNRNEAGELTPLPKPSVDTGMGLERLAAVMQGVHTNYDIDLFKGLLHAAIEVTGTKDPESKSLRVVADHIRACSFLIVDGVLPGNEGRGYVLRRIIRRAIRHGYKLGVEEPFFYRLVNSLEAEMGDAYPELVTQRQHVERVLRQEEERFAETLSQGMRILEDAVADLPDGGVIPGEAVFKLYDTYGFPEDLTADIARERGLSADHAGFETAMAAQRERARKSSRFTADASSLPNVKTSSEFLGYDLLTADTKVVAIFLHGEAVESVEADANAIVVLDKTPFYAESGGQVGDTGSIAGDEVEFCVDDTQKAGAAYGHLGKIMSGILNVGDAVKASVDGGRRAAIVLNHSATHLLHAALRSVLGDHVKQKGSLVAHDRLRFDFSHYEALTGQELEQLEVLVNDQIRINAAAETNVMPHQDAIAGGALAFFGDKYAEDVRVLKLGDFSTELCGGTHVARTGDIGLLKIISESGIASGVRRIEAVTGPGAMAWLQANELLLKDVAGLVKGGREDVAEKVRALVDKNRALEREVQQLKGRLASGGGQDLLDSAIDVAGVKVVVARLDGTDAKTLREAADNLKARMGTGVVVLGAVEQDKVRLVVSVSKDLTKSLKAGDLIGPVAEHVGGRGGGRPDFAQAGGTEPDKLDAALGRVCDEVAAILSRTA
jgi:alanyl-tRNA synthetase